jgi:Urocanase Rossmann-like domain
MGSQLPQPADAAIRQEMEAVYRLYASLAPDMDLESGLGGKLLYAGELDLSACLLLRAANVAGAASLTASADAAVLHQAMRAGALDFVVTNLGEALRILKNEIRKKQPIAVGVSLAHQTIEREMLDRGVQPDLLAPALPSSPELAAFAAHGARSVPPQPLPPGCDFNILAIPPHWDRPLTALDELLLGCLGAADFLNRRWVRLAPRYLSPDARRLRSVACNPGAISLLASRLREKP